MASPPPKPLLIFDGDCHFCRRWIERWRESTEGRIDYVSSQEVGARFPEIAQREFQNAVQLIEPDGEVFAGAEAVFRSLGHAPRHRWLPWCYERVHGFAPATETAYSLVARNRHLASKATRWLWGDDVRRPTYYNARRWFLRTLGLVYLIAFISAWAQIDGLMGEHGLTPAGRMLSLFGSGGVFHPGLALRWPTLCWFSASSTMLHGLCASGSAAAALLAFGILPLPALLVCFGCYLSLIVPGEAFFSYQWDILLLETGFVAIFVSPLQWRMARANDPPVSRIGLFLVKFLLFKLMFMSGIVKLTSGDDAWWKLTALDYHYWTQPLPTVFAWFADKSPDWLKRLSVAATLFTEIVVPFFIWAPRRFRHAAAVLLIALQIAITITGNYCFFNLLAIALCLVVIDDTAWHPHVDREIAAPQGRRWANLIPALALIITLPLNLCLTCSAFERRPNWPRSVIALYARLEPFRLANGYGLFRVMTKERPEIIFEGSADGVDWQPYEFGWKPGDPHRRPLWNAPHQPRLDWSMWFAALGSERDRVVAEAVAAAMLRNDASVLGLLAGNPFTQTPPRFVRATLYQYRFTTAEERGRTGDWWARDDGTAYLPAVSLQDFR
ncbi:MAG: lipase maturation factor family protein [Chthoniobacterales bacterium]|nr:lipase maturation factor family protein [Chthoniobacterales bacterium]